MRVDDIPIFSMLRGRLSWLNERQRVVAENVANADTPGYAARDLAQPANFAAALERAGGLQMTATAPNHITPQARVSRFEVERAPDSEVTLDGNSVVVEEQMLKMAESRMAYDAAIGFYQKSLNMLRLAARAPGR